MKAVRAIESKRVFYLFADDVDVYLGERLEAPGVMAIDINSQTHEVVYAPQPDLFVGGGALIFDDAWSVANQQAYDEAVAEVNAQSKASNEAQAKQLLESSDWSDLPSVRNVAMTPHLLNGADFDTYRAALRAIVVNPPVTVETWPVRPDAVWS